MNRPAEEASRSDIVTDTMLGGQLVLRQPRRGHRAGTDAVLLAAACVAQPGNVLVDVGCGVGAVGLALARRNPGISGFLLDDDPFVSGLAEENCCLNHVGSRFAVATADLFDPASRCRAGILDGRADVVVTNPPFFVAEQVRASTDRAKARAHVIAGASGSGRHADWLRAAASLLGPKGRFYAIHRPETLPALLDACEGRLGAVVLKPIHAKPNSPAIRFLMAAQKGSRAPLALAPPLVLHGPDGRFTPEAEAVHRGEALLPL